LRRSEEKNDVVPAKEKEEFARFGVYGLREKEKLRDVEIEGKRGGRKEIHGISTKKKKGGRGKREIP